MQKLPERKGFVLREQVDTDVREACAKAEAKIKDAAAKYHVLGWKEDSWSFDVTPGGQAIVGKLVLLRE